MAIGSYADANYRTRQFLELPATGSLAGTAASASELMRRKMMFPVRIVSANAYYVAGGTDASILRVTINRSVAGTGALTSIGTLVIGTQATGTIKDIPITEIDLDMGDHLVIQRAAGTSAVVANVILNIGYRERFVL